MPDDIRMPDEGGRFVQCPDCGGLKPEGGLCRRCESGVPPASGTTATWAGTSEVRRRSKGVPRWVWVIVVAVIVLGGAAVWLALPRGEPDYESSFGGVAGAMIAASAELGAYMSRGGGWTADEAERIRAASIQLNTNSERAIRLKPSSSVIEAHSLLTGAAVGYQRACEEIAASLAAHEGGAPTDILAQAARSSLSAADRQLGEARLALSSPPPGGT